MTRVLVTGANGQLGSELKRLSGTKKDVEFIFTDVDALNITNENDIAEFPEIKRVQFLVNCAAYTAVDRAEDEPEKAFLLNGDAVDRLGRICSRYSIRLIHISTDFVFDGKHDRPYLETDIPNPLSVYGKSKRIGEEKLQKQGYGIIIRTSWLYSSFGNNFVKTILRLALEKDELKVVSDQTGSPTWAADLARIIRMMVDRLTIEPDHPRFCIYHFSNKGSCTWYDFATEILRVAGLKTKVLPVTSSEYSSKAIRPSFSVLNTSLISNWLKIDIPDWKYSLAQCLKEIINHK
jgi:dTDP-4-dehydrorhamnose reductase